MNKYFIFFLLVFSSLCYAQETTIALEKAPVNIHDVESIKRGAKFFGTVCIVCHTMVYLRYNTLAKEAGVTYERMPVNITQWPFDIKPPDLSLEANVRSADWIYTYLHSFYADTSRPTGANNLVNPNTAMTAILAPFQGQQALVGMETLKTFNHPMQWYDALELKSQGSMSPQQFDGLVTDIVNFLVYAADPYQVEQRNLGKWVIAFLLVFFVLAYLLKKNYWKNIH
jgi:ubiquinol-cytochrome c reductase cytochrome c1 subunit